MTLSPEHQSARMSKNYKWRLNPVIHRQTGLLFRQFKRSLKDILI